MGDPRHDALAGWYGRDGRDLPWRRTSDPWPILVSEMMLQQTPVSRVIPVYETFVSSFPTPADMAASEPARVLMMWAGLGYLRRAMNLWRASRIVAAEGWPVTTHGLESLPGVGPYTAAAVASFAFGEPVPAVDTNLRRVLSRWEGLPLEGSALLEAAHDRLDRRDPARWNHTMMDLGALLCRPRSPDCGRCPVAEWCADPGVYTPPPRQTPYAGSHRQARAAVLKLVAADGPIPHPALADRLGMDADRVEAAVANLLSERMLEAVEGAVQIVQGAAPDPARE